MLESNDNLLKKISLLESENINLKNEISQFKGLLKNNPLGYQSLDLNGCLLEVNEKICEIFDLNREEFIGTYPGDYFIDESRTKFENNFFRLKQNGFIYNGEYSIRKQNGDIAFLLMDGMAVYNQNKEYIFSHCLVRDITEKKLVNKIFLISSSCFYLSFMESLMFSKYRNRTPQ